MHGRKPLTGLGSFNALRVDAVAGKTYELESSPNMQPEGTRGVCWEDLAVEIGYGQAEAGRQQHLLAASDGGRGCRNATTPRPVAQSVGSIAHETCLLPNRVSEEVEAGQLSRHRFENYNSQPSDLYVSANTVEWVFAIPGHTTAFSKLSRPFQQLLLAGLTPAA